MRSCRRAVQDDLTRARYRGPKGVYRLLLLLHFPHQWSEMLRKRGRVCCWPCGFYVAQQAAQLDCVINEASAGFLSFGTLIQRRNNATELESQHAEKLPRDQKAPRNYYQHFGLQHSGGRGLF